MASVEKPARLLTAVLLGSSALLAGWAMAAGISVRALSRRNQAAQGDTGAIVGIVQDAQGAPLADAKVTIVHKDESSSVLAQADGRFEKRNLAVGAYTVTAEAPGFRKDSVEVIIGRAGETVSALLRLNPSSLHVAVFDSGTKLPLAGVVVSLFNRERAGPAQPAARAVTDQAGDAYFGRLDPGSYQIAASLRGYDEYRSVVFISSEKVTTLFNFPLSIAPLIPVNDKLSVRYSVPNLPSKNVLCIFQDSQGWMWFGTDKGLARFNGTDFRNSSAAGSPYASLAGSQINSILEDGPGTIFLATSRGIRMISKDGDDAGSLLNGVAVTNLSSGPAGAVWISSATGEYRYQDGQLSAIGQSEAANEVRASAVTRPGRVMVATADGLEEVDGGKMVPVRSAGEDTSASGASETRRRAPARPRGLRRSATLPASSGPVGNTTGPAQTVPGGVRTVFVDRQDRLWTSTGDGVFEYQGDAASTNPVLAHLSVNAICEDRRGRMWFALDSTGVLLYNPGHQEIQRLSTVDRDKVNALFCDREGNVWFGTDNGAVRADLYSFVDFNTSRGLADNQVNAVVQTPRGPRDQDDRSVWFATAAGVSVLSGERLVPLEGFRSNLAVRAVAFDSSGAAWFATSEGVFKLDQESLTQINEGNGLSSDDVNGISTAGGSMVIATAKGADLYKAGSLASIDQLKGYDVRYVSEDRRGHLWFATSQGVVGLNEQSHSVDALIDSSRGLLSDDVRWIAVAGDRVIAATRSGVQSFDCGSSNNQGAAARIEIATIDTEAATTLLADRDGFLWIGTDDGQVKKLAVSSNATVSTVYSGETNALTNKRINSIEEDGEGNIWIGTAAGAVRHVPDKAIPLAHIDIDVDGRPLPTSPLGGAISGPVSSSVCSMPYGAGKITFRFTGVTMEGQTRFIYRLANDRDNGVWKVLPVRQSGEHEVTLPGTGDGTYTFEIKALNRDLYGVQAPAASLVLRVGPPFWKRVWFYTLFTLFAAASAAAALRARRRRRMEYVLPRELRTFVPIEPNPYIVGNPIRGEKMFFGREDDFRYVRVKLQAASQGVVIVFCGERRVGKSSILYQLLNGRLGERFVPVFIDMQEMVIASDSEFFARISRLIADGVDKAPPVPALEPAEAGAAGILPGRDRDSNIFEGKSDGLEVPHFDGRNPYHLFLDFLDDAIACLQGKTLLLLVDEYELLESKVDDGKLSHEFFTFLAGLMDNKERVGLIFTGSRRLEERDRKYWRELLRRSLFRKVGFLSEKDTFRLITEPVEGRVVYGKGVVERVYRLASGQPFYTQVICQNLVDFMNEDRHNWVTLAQLDKVILDILDNPLPQMIYAWDGMSDDEKVVQSLLAERLAEPSAFATAGELRISVKVNDYPVQLSENTIRMTLEELFRRDFLEKDATEGFRFRMDLFRLWIERAHSIWQVINEARTL